VTINALELLETLHDLEIGGEVSWNGEVSYWVLYASFDKDKGHAAEGCQDTVEGSLKRMWESAKQYTDAEGRRIMSEAEADIFPS